MGIPHAEICTVCPHCRSDLKIQNPTTGISNLEDRVVRTDCCNKFVVVHPSIDFRFTVRIPHEGDTKEYGLDPEDCKGPKLPRLNQMRPDSKWTHVGYDGCVWFVRFAPKNMDCAAMGRPWGLMFGTPCATAEEAHRFADSIDEFMDEAFKSYKAK